MKLTEINPDDIQIFEMQSMNRQVPFVIIRYNGYDTNVSEELLLKMAYEYNFGMRLKNDRVAFYKEAVKYEQYIDFEMVTK